MYYRADVYIDSVIINSFIADSIKVLKIKAEPFIKDEKITEIIVSQVNEIGFFKLPKEIEKVIDEKFLL